MKCGKQIQFNISNVGLAGCTLSHLSTLYFNYLSCISLEHSYPLVQDQSAALGRSRGRDQGGSNVSALEVKDMLSEVFYSCSFVMRPRNSGVKNSQGMVISHCARSENEAELGYFDPPVTTRTMRTSVLQNLFQKNGLARDETRRHL